MNNDLYNELAIDLVENCRIDMFTARRIVAFLKQENHIDYDALKEYYQDEEDEI